MPEAGVPKGGLANAGMPKGNVAEAGVPKFGVAKVGVAKGSVTKARWSVSRRSQKLVGGVARGLLKSVVGCPTLCLSVAYSLLVSLLVDWLSSTMVGGSEVATASTRTLELTSRVGKNSLCWIGRM